MAKFPTQWPEWTQRLSWTSTCGNEVRMPSCWLWTCRVRRKLDKMTHIVRNKYVWIWISKIFLDMEFIEALTEGLPRVLLVRGTGSEVVTIYSWIFYQLHSLPIQTHFPFIKYIFLNAKFPCILTIFDRYFVLSRHWHFSDPNPRKNTGQSPYKPINFVVSFQLFVCFQV